MCGPEQGAERGRAVSEVRVTCWPAANAGVVSSRPGCPPLSGALLHLRS